VLKDKAIQEYHLNFEKSISNIEVDLFTKKIWLETESTNSLFSVNLFANCQLEEHNIAVDRKLYPSLKAVGNDFLVFTDIVNPSMSNELKLLVFDVSSKKNIHESIGYRFNEFKDSRNISISKLVFENIQYENIELSSSLKGDKLLPDWELQMPSLIVQEDSEYENMKLYLEEKLELAVFGPIEYFEEKFGLILSFHSQKDKNYNKYLLILNEDGKITENWTLNENLSKIRSDSFFVFGKYLVFVKSDKSLEIKILN
jgi:hypothetical protein